MHLRYAAIRMRSPINIFVILTRLHTKEDFLLYADGVSLCTSVGLSDDVADLHTYDLLSTNNSQSLHHDF